MNQENKNKEISPIFITGSVRSGTSIINEALVKGAGIQGYEEGCFIDFLGIFLKGIDNRFNEREVQRRRAHLMLNDVNFVEFKRELSDWFINQYKKYSKYEGVFIDKTPNLEVVYSISSIHSSLPSSKFILMKRRPIENMESRLKKFPAFTFEKHCEFWSKIMENIYSLKSELPTGSFIIIDQYDISMQPEKVANELGVFLNLNFNQIKNVMDIFINKRPEFTGGDEKEIKSLEEMTWTDEQKKFFLETCGPIAEKFGWSLEKKYYKD